MRKIEIDINQLKYELNKFQKENNKVITTKDIKNIPNIPCAEVLRRRFGSFENVLKLCDMDYDIKFHNFDRKDVSIDAALELLRLHTIEKQQINPYLLTVNDINKNKNMPCMSVYTTRLGGLKNAYKMIGINYEEYNFNILKQEYLNQYINLSKILKRTPTSRDVCKYSKDGLICSSSTLIRTFGSMKNLQNEANLELTKHSYPTKTKQEMINDLYNLSKILGRMPTQRDVNNSNDILCSDSYRTYFGTFNNALLECGFSKKDLNNRIYVTPNGIKCYSRLEYLFARVLENNNIKFDKDVKYKDLIRGFRKPYACDFKIYLNDKIYLIEIFGITGSKLYEEKTKAKIKLCEDNNLNLIQIYPQLLHGSKQSEVLDYVLEKIKIFEKKENKNERE